MPGATHGPLHLVLNRKPPTKPIRVDRQPEPVLQTRRAESERRPHATRSESNAVHSRPCGPRWPSSSKQSWGAIPPQDFRWRWNRRFNHRWGMSSFTTPATVSAKHPRGPHQRTARTRTKPARRWTTLSPTGDWLCGQKAVMCSATPTLTRFGRRRPREV